MSSHHKTKVRDETVRDEKYVTAIPTEITLEEASSENPFHTQSMHIFGYEHLELAEKCSFTDMVFLLFRGELPDENQRLLFEQLLKCLINPGPRHPATRAAMTTGIARTKLQHALPISLSVASGSYNGSEDVFNAMNFLNQHIQCNPEDVANESFKTSEFDVEGNPQVAPGFGSFYGGADTYARKLAEFLAQFNESGKYQNFASALIRHWQSKNSCIGWLHSGLCAAVLCDLGFHPRQGNVLFQIAMSPGLAAHAVEKSNKPVTDMPFVPEKDYFIDEQALAKSHGEKD